MSGVEAILGVVSAGAGLLSLAVQLAESGRKLKSFCHTVGMAPQRIQDLVHDLETMALSLRQLEQHRKLDIHDAHLLDRCVARCQKCTAQIQLTVTKIESIISRRAKVGRVYYAWKENDLEKLLVELEQVKSSLMFAFQVYCQ